MLNNVNIVLIETSHPGNIGAVARAMKNMFLSRLTLVSPHKYPSVEATARASGADDILQHARVVENLDQALAESRLVVGTTARDRTIAVPIVDPRECAKLLMAEASGGPVSLMFGREHSGLSNEELDRCHYAVRIPANPEYSSLNLAMAVQILSYELMLAAEAGSVPKPQEDRQPATPEAMEGYFQHLEQTLKDIRFCEGECSEKLLRKLRRFYLRARPDQRELNILRGILTEMQARLKD